MEDMTVTLTTSAVATGMVAMATETHSNNPHYESLYAQANATANKSTRQQIEHEMQQFDFSQGPYIIPTFMDTLDAYSDKIAGYASRSQRTVGEPLSNWDMEHFWFV